MSLVAELIAYPIGVFLAHLLPISRLNPDRHFNIKEHALVTIMSNVSFGFGSADATNIIQAAKLYGFSLQTGFSVMVVLCCQLLGYGVAGISARWLVEPVSPHMTVSIWNMKDNTTYLLRQYKMLLSPACTHLLEELKDVRLTANRRA